VRTDEVCATKTRCALRICEKCALKTKMLAEASATAAIILQAGEYIGIFTCQEHYINILNVPILAHISHKDFPIQRGPQMNASLRPDFVAPASLRLFVICRKNRRRTPRHQKRIFRDSCDDFRSTDLGRREKCD